MSSFRKSITVKRTDGGYYNVDGVWQKGTETQFSIQASVQPTTGEDMMLLPENRREVSSFKIFTDTKLFTSKKGSDREPDILVVDGEDYETIIVYRWQNDIINHWKAIISKKVSNG